MCKEVYVDRWTKNCATSHPSTVLESSWCSHHDHEGLATTRIGFSPTGRYLFVTNDDDGVAVCDLQDDRFSVRYRTGVIDAEFGDRNDLFTAGGITLQRHQVMREPQALAMFGSLLLRMPYFLRPSHRFYRSTEPLDVKLVDQKLWNTERAGLGERSRNDERLRRLLGITQWKCCCLVGGRPPQSQGEG